MKWLFIVAARRADDIRTPDHSESHSPWQYVDFRSKPEGDPDSIKPLPPRPDNILTAIAENQKVLRSTSPDDKRAIALA